VRPKTPSIKRTKNDKIHGALYTRDSRGKPRTRSLEKRTMLKMNLKYYV